MLYVILGILFSISAIFGMLFWFALILAKRSDERGSEGYSESETRNTELQNTAK